MYCEIVKLQLNNAELGLSLLFKMFYFSLCILVSVPINQKLCLSHLSLRIEYIKFMQKQGVNLHISPL